MLYFVLLSVLSSEVEDRIISSLSLALLANDDSTSVAQTQNVLLSLETISKDVILDSGTEISAVEVFTINQEVNKKNETVVHHNDVFSNDQTNNQIETEVVEVLVPSLPSALAEKGVNEILNESSFCDVVQTLRLSRPKYETKIAVDRPQTGTLSRDINLNKNEDIADESPLPEAKSGQSLKVIVPKKLVPIVKQIQLPSVMLTRCTSSETMPVK